MARLLRKEEWDRLRGPVKKLFGEDKEPPPPEVSQCAVEEDEAGNIRGFLFLQLALHMEPFGSLGGASFSELRKVFDAALTDIPGVEYYLHTSSHASVAVYTDHGFKPVGFLLVGIPEK